MFGVVRDYSSSKKTEGPKIKTEIGTEKIQNWNQNSR